MHTCHTVPTDLPIMRLDHDVQIRQEIGDRIQDVGIGDMRYGMGDRR